MTWKEYQTLVKANCNRCLRTCCVGCRVDRSYDEACIAEDSPIKNLCKL